MWNGDRDVICQRTHDNQTDRETAFPLLVFSPTHLNLQSKSLPSSHSSCPHLKCTESLFQGRKAGHGDPLPPTLQLFSTDLLWRIEERVRLCIATESPDKNYTLHVTERTSHGLITPVIVFLFVLGTQLVCVECRIARSYV